MSLKSTVRPFAAIATVLGAALALAAGPATAEDAPRAASDAGFTAFPVPTSAAGLANIVTAPNGDMWFVEEDKNQIGVITPAGEITEFPVGDPAEDTGQVIDLTVAQDGSIWVVYDQGRKIMHGGTGMSPQVYSLGAYPYGENVEMGPDGVPWVTMSFDEDGLARVLPTGTSWHHNAPPCDGALARAHDGGMWCADGDKLVLSSSDASGGTTYPLPENATYPYSLAAGPTGSMWFARYFSTPFTSASRGDVGWIDQATGATTIFNTGSRTGPYSLRAGPDGAMWFTNLGVGKGIGHVHPDGTGAITKVGDYSPRFLTFDHQGFVWFTDEVNNSIVRVDPAELQVTDVEVGEGSIFTTPPPAPPAPPVPPAPPTTIDLPTAPVEQVGEVRTGGKTLRVRRNKVRVPIVCPGKADSACEGAVRLQHKKKDKPFTRATKYRVKPGKRKAVTVKLTKAGKKAIKRRATKVRATLLSRDGAAARHKLVRVRR